MPIARRTRGLLLRLAYTRWTAVALGTAGIVGTVVLWLNDFSWEFWLTDGLALVSGGTGAALVLFGLGARTPDWIDPTAPEAPGSRGQTDPPAS